MKSDKIGKVTVSYIDGESTEYSDGDAEDKLLEIFKSKEPSKKVKQILETSDDWRLIYHLSPLRQNLLSWYNFTPGSSVLEIGAGPGAITSCLSQKDLSITAIDISKRRIHVNAHRNKNNSNLELVVGNFEKLSTKKKFDYVVCVGVLEYSGTFIDSKDPYEYFLNKMKSHLKPGGTLLLAIENKFGLKYWAGVPEDHTGHRMDSINDYATSPKKVRTFTKQELSKMIDKSGFKEHSYFFPHPDYKLPTIIYSDKLYPGHGIDYPTGTPVSNDYSGAEKFINFSEELAMFSVEKSNLFPELANSFLVECHA